MKNKIELIISVTKYRNSLAYRFFFSVFVFLFGGIILTLLFVTFNSFYVKTLFFTFLISSSILLFFSFLDILKTWQMKENDQFVITEKYLLLSKMSKVNFIDIDKLYLEVNGYFLQFKNVGVSYFFIIGMHNKLSVHFKNGRIENFNFLLKSKRHKEEIITRLLLLDTKYDIDIKDISMS